MFSVSQTKSFEASHYIRVDDTPEHYKHIHGHSFVVTATCSAAELAPEGWVVDLGELERVLGEVVALLDHQLLNDIDGLEMPSFENIMAWIYRQMSARGVVPSRIDISRPTLGQAASYTPTA